MKYRLMDILRCPNCRDVLSLNIFLEEEHLSEKKINQIKCREYCSLNDIYLKECLGSISCDSCYKKDIIDGLLKCINIIKIKHGGGTRKREKISSYMI